MVVNKNIIIDGVSYDVSLYDFKRKADILDKTANRTEDGDLHREVIGTYYNYTFSIGVANNDTLYNQLFDVLSAPVEYHEVCLPHDGVTFKGYFGSVQDELAYLTEEGGHFRHLTCNLVAKLPARRPS